MNVTSRKKNFPNFYSIILKYQEVPALLVFVLLFTFFSFLAPNFLTLLNFENIVDVAAKIGIVAIGVNLLMISGEFDLSIGSIFGVVMIVFGQLVNSDIPLPISVITVMLLGILIGFINGFIVTKTKIASFISTLGMMFMLRGIILIASLWKPESYRSSGQTKFLYILNGPIKFLEGTKFESFSASIFWFLILLVIFQLILFKTKFGNSVFAVGGNPEVARAMGINVDRIKIINFMIVGALTALSSCFDFARYRFLDFFSNVNMPLQIIAVVVIGGTLLIGGRGSIIGTFLGASILAMFSSGLILLGVNTYYYRTFVGLLLILAAIIYSVITRRFEKL